MQNQGGSRLVSGEAISHRSFLLFIPGVALLFYSLYLSFLYLPATYFSYLPSRFLLFLVGYVITAEAFLLHWRNRRRAKSRGKSIFSLILILLSSYLFVAPFVSIPFFFRFSGQNYGMSVVVAFALAVGGTFLLRNSGSRHALRRRWPITLVSVLAVPPLVYLLKYSSDAAFNALWGNLSWLGYFALAGAGLLLAICYLGSPEFYSIAFHPIAITMAYVIWGWVGLILIPVLLLESYFTLRGKAPTKEAVSTPPVVAPQAVPVRASAALEPVRSIDASPQALKPSISTEPEPAPKLSGRKGARAGRKLAGKITSKLKREKNRACPACGAPNPVTEIKCSKCGATLPENGTVLY